MLLSETAVREPEGLGWPVYQRLTDLGRMQKSLEEGGDKFEQIANVKTIIKAYKSKKLGWAGLITYWSKGKKLCEPRPFDWDEFEAINSRHDGSKGFWTEGVSIPCT